MATPLIMFSKIWISKSRKAKPLPWLAELARKKHRGEVDSAVFQCFKGKISIGGTDISKISQAELRNLIGYAPQKAMLFSGDIRSNVAYGSGLSDEKIIDALKIAQSWEFVEKLPNGLSEEVSQGGKNFSGGQKQRLSIAQAIAKNAPILIFDDSLARSTTKPTRFFVLNLRKKPKARPSLSWRNAWLRSRTLTKLSCLTAEKIVGIGTHGELLQTNELYREIASSQLSNEEIERKLREFSQKSKAKNPARKEKNNDRKN